MGTGSAAGGSFFPFYQRLRVPLSVIFSELNTEMCCVVCFTQVIT